MFSRLNSLLNIIVIILKFITGIAHPIMNIASLLLAIYGLINIKKFGDLRVFILLPILSFIDSFSLLIFLYIVDQPNTFVTFSEYFQIIFLNSELFIIIIFYSKIFTKVKFKFHYLILIITTLIFLLLRYFRGINIANNYLPIFVVMETLIINISFGKLIIQNAKEERFIISKFTNEINKGFFLFINTTAPYYLIINYLDNHQETLVNYLSFIGNLGYVILFFHIYKAIKCSQLN